MTLPQNNFTVDGIMRCEPVKKVSNLFLRNFFIENITYDTKIELRLSYKDIGS